MRINLKLVPFYEKIISKLPDKVNYSESVFQFLIKINYATLTRDYRKCIIFYMQDPARTSYVLFEYCNFEN